MTTADVVALAMASQAQQIQEGVDVPTNPLAIFRITDWKSDLDKQRGKINTPHGPASIRAKVITSISPDPKYGNGVEVMNVKLKRAPDGHLFIASATLATNASVLKKQLPVTNMSVESLQKFEVGDEIVITFRPTASAEQVEFFIGMCMSAEAIFELSKGDLAMLTGVVNSRSWKNAWLSVRARIKRWDPVDDLENWFLFRVGTAISKIVGAHLPEA